MKVCKCALVLSFFCALLSVLPAQPVISQKQDIAIFSLGYYGWNIPSQALGSIDGEIQKVFSDLGQIHYTRRHPAFFILRYQQFYRCG